MAHTEVGICKVYAHAHARIPAEWHCRHVGNVVWIPCLEARPHLPATGMLPPQSTCALQPSCSAAGTCLGCRRRGLGRGRSRILRFGARREEAWRGGLERARRQRPRCVKASRLCRNRSSHQRRKQLDVRIARCRLVRVALADEQQLIQPGRLHELHLKHLKSSECSMLPCCKQRPHGREAAPGHLESRCLAEKAMDPRTKRSLLIGHATSENWLRRAKHVFA